ncbi:FAD-dependent oxidoreductase [Nocardioides sp.]|uniref:FAD-dependent oxidoreductase n=1 Tax=Nocardioides sp. TaxID=35761 RepID=UPI0031FEC67F|nr:ferredoxin--NADP reductase [Nocardioides sp.]
MPYVVTQSCCSDASCVVACPVNCIHPTPGEPGFAEAEMLYVDPTSCVDCGACATACPVDAIVPHTRLDAAQQPFIDINASYYDTFPHPKRTPLALVPTQRRLRRSRRVRVAVVGAGPAGMYVADELLKHPEISVDVLDRLPTPYGLLRAGVAPDHQHTKQAEKLFRAIESQPGFRYLLGVEVGSDVSLAELTQRYHGVVYSVGAASDRILDIPGEELCCSATDFVGWYNGHPDRQDLAVDLSAERIVVVGIGNVALDVARILTADPDRLAGTDISRLPWATLAGSAVREVVVLGRRGPEQAAFTLPELVGLSSVTGVNVVVDTGGTRIAGDDTRSRILAELAARVPEPGLRTIRLRFLTSPVRILGVDRVEGIEIVRNELVADDAGVLRAKPTGEHETIPAGMVLRSVGYHGKPVADLPYEPTTGIVPNARGRVRPGVYVAGWVKRGPTGFIGTNKSCAQETVERLLDDLDADLLGAPSIRDRDLERLLRDRGVRVVDLDGWRGIDREERSRGEAAGRVRTKIVDIGELLRVAEERSPVPATLTARRRREKRG